MRSDGLWGAFTGVPGPWGRPGFGLGLALGLVQGLGRAPRPAPYDTPYDAPRSAPYRRRERVRPHPLTCCRVWFRSARKSAAAKQLSCMVLWSSLECSPPCQGGGRGFKSRQDRSAKGPDPHRGPGLSAS